MIPEPEEDLASHEFSGKFMSRIPKSLHRALALEAKQNGLSLNQFVTSLLASGLETAKTTAKFDRILAEIDLLKNHICDLKCNIEKNLSMQLKFTAPSYTADGYEDFKAA